MTKTKKIFLSLLAVASFAIFNATGAQAIGLDSFSPGSLDSLSATLSGKTVDKSIDSAFNKVGLDENELKYFVQTFNVSRQKKQQPQLSLSFNPSDPTPGQKVTVVATPLYFMNDIKNLYFTWYLKPAGCPSEEKHSPSDEIKDKCDFNKDGHIDIEDYKVNAMRIIASNGFEWKKASYSGSGAGSSYKASWGGDDQKGKSAYCYVHDVESGDEYQIKCDDHLFPNAPEHTTGDGDFDMREEEFWHTNPNADDTAATGNGDEANVAGLGVSSFTWTYDEGDKVGVVVEGISVEPTQVADSSYRTMWALVNNKCDLGSKSVDDEYSKITNSISYSSTGACGANVDDQQITTTTIKTIIGQTATTLTDRTATYTTTITDANCDGVYDEAPGAAANKQTTCPTGDTNTTLDGYACIGADEIINLNEGDVSLEHLKSASDINKCLYSNLADPKEGGGQAEKMSIALSYSPDFPMNDPAEDSDQGDIVTVSSSITNAQNNGYLKYKWEVFASDTPNPEDWGDAISTQYLPDASQTIGLDLTSFQFRLNLTNAALSGRVKSKNRFYIKVKATVSENVSEHIGESAGDNSNVAKREGYGDVVIPISSTSDNIKVYSAAVSQSGSGVKLSPSSTERCSDGISKSLCPVTKDEIIALKVNDSNLTDFLWTLDGATISPASSDCLSGDCKSSTMESTGISYFPVTDEVGTMHSVTLKAINSKTGDKINITKNFIIVDPTVSITSANSNSSPKLLGNYIDTDGKYWPDYSKTDFLALSSMPITLDANFYGFSPSGDNYSWHWVVDGTNVDKDNAEGLGYGINDRGALTLPGKSAGETYNVGVVVLYTQDSLTKKALNTFWNVGYNEFYEQQLSTDITVTASDTLPDGTTAKNNTPQKKILAALYSAIPGYLAFLLRIVLTTFVMLIAAGISSSLFSGENKIYEA